jgi:hypothetical protein
VLRDCDTIGVGVGVGELLKLLRTDTFLLAEAEADPAVGPAF